MSDLNPPTPPPTPSDATTNAAPAPSSGSGTTSMGLEPKILAGVAAVLQLITALVVFFVEKKNTTVRFWAAQLICLWGPIWVFNIAMNVVFILLIGMGLGILVKILSALIGFACFGLWILTLVFGFSGGGVWRIPIVAPFAEKLVAKFPATA